LLSLGWRRRSWLCTSELLLPDPAARSGAEVEIRRAIRPDDYSAQLRSLIAVGRRRRGTADRVNQLEVVSDRDASADAHIAEDRASCGQKELRRVLAVELIGVGDDPQAGFVDVRAVQRVGDDFGGADGAWLEVNRPEAPCGGGLGVVAHVGADKAPSGEAVVTDVDAVDLVVRDVVREDGVGTAESNCGPAAEDEEHGEGRHHVGVGQVRTKPLTHGHLPYSRLGRKPKASASPLGLVGGSGDRRMFTATLTARPSPGGAIRHTAKRAATSPTPAARRLRGRRRYREAPSSSPRRLYLARRRGPH